MKDLYQKTVYYWNEQYESLELYDSAIALDETIETALDWLTAVKGRIIDIGSGKGYMALRCLHKGALKVIGIEPSFYGTSLARQSSAKYFNTLQTQWVWGKSEAIAQLPDACCVGVILSHILECLRPDEGRNVIEESVRVLDHQGRLLMILPAYQQELEEASNWQALQYRPVLDEFGEVESGAFTTPEGLYLWNLSDAQIHEMMMPHFEVVFNSCGEAYETLDDGSRVYRYQLKENQ